jgi:hypothetical protein
MGEATLLCCCSVWVPAFAGMTNVGKLILNGESASTGAISYGDGLNLEFELTAFPFIARRNMGKDSFLLIFVIYY